MPATARSLSSSKSTAGTTCGVLVNGGQPDQMAHWRGLSHGGPSRTTPSPSSFPNLTLTATTEAVLQRDGPDDIHIHPGGQGFLGGAMLRHLKEKPLQQAPSVRAWWRPAQPHQPMGHRSQPAGGPREPPVPSSRIDDPVTGHPAVAPHLFDGRHHDAHGSDPHAAAGRGRRGLRPVLGDRPREHLSATRP